MNHLVTTRFRLNKIRVFFDKFQPLICIFSEFKEVAFLFNLLYRAATIWACMVFTKFLLSPECFARCTVPTFIFSLVNIAFFISFCKELLYYLFMAFISSTNEVIVRDMHLLPQCFKAIYDIRSVFKRCNTLRFCSTLNFLTMFIRTSQETYIITSQTLESSDCISYRCTIRMTNVQLSTWIINWCRNIIRFFCVSHDESPSNLRMGRFNVLQYYIHPGGKR